MKKIVKFLIEIGIDTSATEQVNQRIRFANKIALIHQLFIVLITVLLLYQYGFKAEEKLVILSSIIPIGVLALNRLGKTTLSKYWVSYAIPIFIISIPIFIKLNNEIDQIGIYEFFDSRMVIMISSIIPLLLFARKNLLKLILALLPSAVLLLFYDNVHHFFNVGYRDIFEDAKGGYYIVGILFNFSYIFGVVGILALKKVNETLVENNRILIGNLNDKNQTQEKTLLRKQDLLSKNKEVNDRLLTKQEEILKRKQRLEITSKLISEQKDELEYKNIELNSKVEERTKALKQANEELIVQNNGLLQFSNTVSHNLRAPVASLLGLVHLFEVETEESRKKEMLSHIKSSSVALDTVISDLNKVVDIRNQLYHLKENIELKDKINKIEELLKVGLDEIGASLKVNLEVKNIYFIRSYLHSILYNLISNAMKYSKPDENNIISVLSYGDAKSVSIEVVDNGIGIDLVKFGNDMFKMHKRFHYHIEGKGMGLYLVKQQVESMNGKIFVESEPGKGSKFIMKFPIQQEITFQEYYKSPFATISYNANLKASVLIWSQLPDSVEYKNVLSINKEMFVNYNATSWIIDVRNNGIISEEDRYWFSSKVLGEIIKRGCKTIIIVKFESDGKDFSYWQKMLDIANSMGVLFKMFFDYQQAIEFIKEK